RTRPAGSRGWPWPRPGHTSAWVEPSEFHPKSHSPWSPPRGRQANGSIRLPFVARYDRGAAISTPAPAAPKKHPPPTSLHGWCRAVPCTHSHHTAPCRAKETRKLVVEDHAGS